MENMHVIYRISKLLIMWNFGNLRSVPIASDGLGSALSNRKKNEWPSSRVVGDLTEEEEMKITGCTEKIQNCETSQKDKSLGAAITKIPQFSRPAKDWRMLKSLRKHCCSGNLSLDGRFLLLVNAMSYYIRICHRSNGSEHLLGCLSHFISRFSDEEMRERNLWVPLETSLHRMSMASSLVCGFERIGGFLQEVTWVALKNSNVERLRKKYNCRIQIGAGWFCRYFVVSTLAACKNRIGKPKNRQTKERDLLGHLQPGFLRKAQKDKNVF